MTGQSKETMKVLLKKFATSDLLLLSEAAAKLKVTEKYLEGLLKAGKIKGFKVGESWFVEEDWLNDFRCKIKQSLREESPAVRLSSGSSRSYIKVYNVKVQQPSQLKINWQLEIQKWAWGSFGLATAVICLAIFCVPFISVGAHRQELSAVFLNGVFQVYEAPQLVVGQIDRQVAWSLPTRINDEALTRFFGKLWQSSRLYRPGQVAGEVEVRTGAD
jgi:hypothetical protein